MSLAPTAPSFEDERSFAAAREGKVDMRRYLYGAALLALLAPAWASRAEVLRPGAVAAPEPFTDLMIVTGVMGLAALAVTRRPRASRYAIDPDFGP